MIKTPLFSMCYDEKESENKVEDLHAKAKLLIEKIKIEVSALDEALDLFNDEHGVDDDNIASLQKLLEMARTLNGRNEI